jgi:O-antigen/teichoic acid export membrane protein
VLARRLDAETRDWAVVTGASIARLGLGFVASVVIARSLGVADFGVYALLGSLASLAGVLGDPGLTQAGVKRVASVWPSDAAQARERGQVFFWLRIGAMLPLVGGGIALSAAIARWVLGHPEIGGLVALAFLGVGATAASGAVSTLLQATGRFDRLSVILLVNSGLTAALALGLAATGRLTLATALLVLGIGTSLVSFGLGWSFLPWRGTLKLPRGAVLRDEGGRLWRFGRWLWVADALGIAGSQLDVLLVNAWSSLSSVGAYALALNLASKADVVNHSLYTVLLPAASSVSEPAATRAYVWRAVRRSALISLALLPAFPLAGPLITLFYGAAFRDAVGLFQLLLAVVLFDLFATPLTLLTFSYNRPGLVAAGDAARVVVLVGVAALLLPVLGPLGAVAARAASRVAGAAVILAALWMSRGLAVPAVLPPDDLDQRVG